MGIEYLLLVAISAIFLGQRLYSYIGRRNGSKKEQVTIVLFSFLVFVLAMLMMDLFKAFPFSMFEYSNYGVKFSS